MLLCQITLTLVVVPRDKVSKDDPKDFTTMVKNDLLQFLSHMKDL